MDLKLVIQSDTFQQEQAVQGLSANTDYKVKALVGTTGISLQTTEGADICLFRK